MRILAGAAVLVMLGSIGGLSAAPPTSKQVATEEVRTKKLTVVDSTGEPRAIISVSDATGDVVLSLHAAGGETMAALGLRKSGASSLSLYDRNDVRVTVAFDPRIGGAVMLSTADGRTARMITEKELR